MPLLQGWNREGVDTHTNSYEELIDLTSIYGDNRSVKTELINYLLTPNIIVGVSSLMDQVPN